MDRTMIDSGLDMIATPAAITRTDAALYDSAERTHYFGCSIDRLVSLTALGVRDEVRYLADLRRRQIEFVTCLINPRDEGFAYDLRIVARPDTELPTRGRIALAVLCRTADVAQQAALDQAHRLLHLLTASFEEYEVSLLDAAGVQSMLAPFPIRQLVAVTRRSAHQPLDTLRGAGSRRQRVGFAPEKRRGAEQSFGNHHVFHVFPFLASAVSFNNLFKLLLLEREPIAISCCLRPTALTIEEEKFLEDQITACERHAQVNLGQVTEDLSSLQPTLRELARVHQHHQTRSLFGLRDNAGLMTMQIASAGPILPLISDALGSLMTGPAGGGNPNADGGIASYLAGGYETVNLTDEPGAMDGFEHISPFLPTDPSTPLGAERLLHLFDSVEATAAFRLPPSTLDTPPGVELRAWREAPAPRDLPESGVLMGVSVEAGLGRQVRISPTDRQRHCYIVGQTGTGKSTLIRTMILDDIRAGEGICVLDPHGDLYKELLGKIPADRINDVVLLDPTDVEYPVGLNLLEYETESQRHFLIQELVGIITTLMQDEFGDGAKQFMGPLFSQHMRMNLLLTMSRAVDPGTLLEFYMIFQEADYWRRWIPLHLDDPLLVRWVHEVLSRADYQKPGSEGASMGGYVSSKFESFVFDPMLRNIFGQKRSTIDLGQIMDSGKILLVNLAKGELTDANSRFLGMVLLAKLQAAAMARSRLPDRARRPFYLYVDEFQSIATQGFVTLLSEARKFGVSVVLANQFISQIKDARIAEAIFGNVGTLVCFRLGQTDAERMEKEMAPVFSSHDLLNLPNWQAYISTLIDDQAVRPFSLRTVRDIAFTEHARTVELLCISRSTHSRLRSVAEQEIGKSLTSRLQ